MAKRKTGKEGANSGIISGTKVIVGDSQLRSFLKEKGFGEETGKRHELSLIEAAYLLDNGKMEVVDGKKALSFEDLLKAGNKAEKDFYAKYTVYSDLRGRGLLVRTGLKFGADFRVYERGATVKTSHSKYLVHVVPEEYTCSLPQIAGLIRVSQTVNKAMIYAVVDEEGDITYYEIERVRL
ncbi:MAG: tRNA-intron lyase [Candidatus Altiarchaeota archaeon]|nr:tRNA-intron lyase [Candidatus Altiarchaeota archaeon]